ncbi:MAG TPA: methyltransferase domain-containing protein [Candidatus Binatia bacterium]|jgi:ubiquinone/menaquinone biosynthesis C-methylase UbiE
MSKSLQTPFLSGAPQPLPPIAAERTPILSELVTYENRHGQRIVGFHDYAESTPRDRPWMIVLPGYGETKTDVLAPSFYFAKNGFHTLRFDYSDHVGESDGEILTTTLPKLKDDILSAVDFLQRRYAAGPIGAFASSLACRSLLRAAREDERIALLINFVSIVDVRKTLFAIYKEDHLERTLKGLPNGLMDVLGFQVDADNFLCAAIAGHYEDLAATLEDARGIKAPGIFFAAENDVWVELDDVEEVVSALPTHRKELRVLQEGMHRLYENPAVAKAALKGAVEYALRYLPTGKPAARIGDLDLKEIGHRIRREKERYRLLRGVNKDDEREFWKTYLEKYSFIINVHDYWNLLDFIYRVVGEPKPGQRVLDAGCGIGNYGTFLLMKHMYRMRQTLSPGVDAAGYAYVGVDFVNEAVAQARRTHAGLSQEFATGGPPARHSYLLADLESPLPFPERSFDQVCMNLVVSYLQEPGRALADMARLLKPKGRIVVTSLKPFADLSQVYRNYVSVTEEPRQVEEARKLLSNAGKVMAKEAEGIYRFFTEEELADLLKEAGLTDIETFRAFGNQANVAFGVVT